MTQTVLPPALGRTRHSQALLIVVVAAVATAGLLIGARGSGPAVFLAFCAAVGTGAVAALAVRAAPAWLLSLGLVIAPMAGNWHFVGVPGALAPDRFLLLAGVVATLARVPAVASRPAPRVRASHWLFAVYFAYAVGSALVVGTIFTNTVFQFERAGLTAAGCFLVAPVAFARFEERCILLWCLCGVGAYLGLLAVAEIAAPSAAFPSFVTDPSVARHLGRARGPFLEAEVNGFALYACLLAAVILRSVATTSRERVVAVAVIVLCGLGVLLTLTRITWIGAVLGSVLVLAATPGLRRYLLPAGAALVLLVVGAFAVVPGLQAAASKRASNEQTVWDRQNLNRAAVNMVLDKPLTGQGWNRFKVVGNDYFWQADTYPLGTIKAKAGAHNVPLSIASELGLIGLTLWAAAFAAAFWEGLTGPAPGDLRLWRLALMALLVQFVMHLVAAPADHPFLAVLILVWAGIAAGPNSLQPRVDEI